MRLLVIETDQLFRDNLVHHLRQRGFFVFTGEDSQEISKILGKEAITVALLGLGGMRREGLAVLRQIRDQSPATEVILMTTPDSIQHSIEGMRLGAFDDVLVPFDIDLLCSKIKQAKAGRKVPDAC
ncbi:MAG TPA: response regulator [Desulfonatronum sp.]|nr:response regulator [Desulfonatronum sp.]